MPNIYDMADIWNDSLTTFTAIKMNVIDTASAAASKLIDLQVGGATKFSVSQGGLGIFKGGLEAYRSINVANVEGVSLGQNAGAADASDSINIGFFAGAGTTTGVQAVRVGRHAGFDSGSNQAVLIGHAAGQYAYSCDSSVIIGYLAARNAAQNVAYLAFSSVIIGHEAATNGLNNQSSVVLGALAGKATTSGISAVIIGSNAGAAATNAEGAVIIGRLAGGAATNSNYSILIGHKAGQTLSRHNTLVIEGNETYAPAGNTGLIYGEFDNRWLYINGNFTIRPGTAVTPGSNGDLTFEATANTTVTVKLKGSDGTVRSVALTLA
jgi:hypothetical protein